MWQYILWTVNLGFSQANHHTSVRPDLGFSFPMAWLRARQCTKTALENSRNTWGSSPCSSANFACCTNAAWRWPLTCRRGRRRSEKRALWYINMRLLPGRCVLCTERGFICCPCIFSQIVPYVGEELVNVRVEPCSPSVHQERKEVLEVKWWNNSRTDCNCKIVGN